MFCTTTVQLVFGATPSSHSFPGFYGHEHFVGVSHRRRVRAYRRSRTLATPSRTYPRASDYHAREVLPRYGRIPEISSVECSSERQRVSDPHTNFDQPSAFPRYVPAGRHRMEIDSAQLLGVERSHHLDVRHKANLGH